MHANSKQDVVIIGGGVIGLTCALDLARRGAQVLVLERGIPGAEASSAAAGILGAQVEPTQPGPLANLAIASRTRYPEFARNLSQSTGIDLGYSRCGVLKVAFSENVEKLHISTHWQPKAGLSVELLDTERLREIVPGIGPTISGGVRFPDDGQIDPALLVRALQRAILDAKVELRSGIQVRGIWLEGDQARGVHLEGGERIAANHTILAAGSWSSQLEGLPQQAREVKPARGQILELDGRIRPFEPVIYGPGAYLVPRTDGRVLIGSTLEFVGHRKQVTARAVRDLLTAATAIWPSLEEASLTRTWSGFRPHTEVPLLGPCAYRGLVLATGHYRNGILLAPITGEIIADACEGKTHTLLSSLY